jgi:23S rRNA (uracil1939-C5)-methyltransferase
VDEIVLRVDALAAGGDGVGRAPDGRAVFVPFSCPGDLARVRVTAARRAWARARIVDLLEPGPERVEPRCAVFGSCGGCAWQHLSYAAQLDAKAAILGDALRRIGGLEWGEPVPITPSPSPYAYRGRTRLRVQRGRVGYRRRRSHQLCVVSTCPVLHPALDARLGELAADPPRRDGEWEIALGTGAVRASVLDGRPGERVFLEVARERLGTSPGVFAQSNALLLDALVGRVGAVAGDGSLLLELFAGAALFTLSLSKRFERVVALEGSPAAARDLRVNLQAAGREGVEVLERRLEAAGPELERLHPDLVLLDPPRTGLERDALEMLADLGAPRIAYLSCDPATLARDLARFGSRGYRLRQVEGFDLFPQTPHLEALALLVAEGS